MSDINLQIIDNYDFTISERGNTYIALRKVKWTPTSDVKMDLRKYVTNSNGDEQIQKGVCFDDEAADELTQVLCDTGFGDTKELCKSLSKREDFLQSVCLALSGDDQEKLQEVFPDLKLDELVVDEDEEYIDIRDELEC